MALTIENVVSSYLNLRITFSGNVVKSDDLVDPTNYQIDSIGDGVGCVVGIVTPEDVDEPVYIDLECTDITNGEMYQLTIEPDKIQEVISGHYLVEPNNVASFEGVSEYPEIQTIRATSSTAMEIVFTKDMSMIASLSDPTNYTFDKGLRVIAVTVASHAMVRLTTTPQTSSELYTLTIT